MAALAKDTIGRWDGPISTRHYRRRLKPICLRDLWKIRDQMKEIARKMKKLEQREAELKQKWGDAWDRGV